MQINLEAADLHAIQSYSNESIQIKSIIYSHSLIVSKQEIISDLAIKSILDIDTAYIDLLLKNQPELIIIGHGLTGKFPSMDMISALSQQQIGFEAMDIGAAARTFNVLLNEGRNVVAGFIFGA